MHSNYVKVGFSLYISVDHKEHVHQPGHLGRKTMWYLYEEGGFGGGHV